MRLENIGFYTLTDERAATASPVSPLYRCELLVTDACNFACPYCRGVATRQNKHMSWAEAKRVLDLWIDDGLVNLRLSGGEPTLWPHIERAVWYAKRRGVKRIAISTNGSADRWLYERLAKRGVSDFSISFDACCSSTGDTMAGKRGVWDKIVDNTRRIAALSYVSVGVVLTEDNLPEVERIVELADSIGVADIRIIPAAQNGSTCAVSLPQHLIDAHPILKYRMDNMVAGRPFRGLQPHDTPRCSLVLDDMAVSDGKHYPCIIYLREGGEAIGTLCENTRTERAVWSATHNTHADPICRANCLDVCVDYNNRVRDLTARQTGRGVLRVDDVVRGDDSRVGAGVSVP